MTARPLTELRKMSHQLNSIKKENLIQSILNATESPDDVNIAVREQFKTLIEEITELKKAVTSPESIINKTMKGLLDQVNKQQEIIAKQQSIWSPWTGRKGGVTWCCLVCLQGGESGWCNDRRD